MPPAPGTFSLRPSSSWDTKTRQFLEGATSGRRPESSRKESERKGSERGSSSSRRKEDRKDERKDGDLESVEWSLRKLKEEVEKAEGETTQQTKRESLLEKNLRQLRQQYGQLLREAQRRGRRADQDPLLVENQELQKTVKNGLEETQDGLAKLRETVRQLRDTMESLIAAKAKLKSATKGEKEAESSKSGKKKKRKRSSKSRSPSPASQKKKEKRKKSEEGEKKSPIHYQFYDGGNHFCVACKAPFPTVFAFLAHLHSSQHADAMPNPGYPWMPEHVKDPARLPPPPPNATILSEKIKGEAWSDLNQFIVREQLELAF